MTVLYLNNYACDKESFALVEQHKYPKCHLWGAYELYHKAGVNLIIPDINIPAFENSPDSRIVRFLKLLLFQVKIFLKYSKKVDCVYSACGHLTEVFVSAKRLKLYRGGVVMICHHPCKILFYSTYSKIICISRETEHYLAQKYSGIKTEYKYWGVDMGFYEEIVPKNHSPKKYDIISNGKAFRDFQLLEKGVTDIGLKTLIIGKENSDSKFIEYKAKASSVENVKFCSEAKAMCIAINSQNNGICGITSLNDALAFEIPVLISDNARLGFDVEQIGIGLIYKAGDLQSFEEKLKVLVSDTFISKAKLNIRKFRQENPYKGFSEFIAKIVCEE